MSFISAPTPQSCLWNHQILVRAAAESSCQGCGCSPVTQPLLSPRWRHDPACAHRLCQGAGQLCPAGPGHLQQTRSGGATERSPGWNSHQGKDTFPSPFYSQLLSPWEVRKCLLSTEVSLQCETFSMDGARSCRAGRRGRAGSPHWALGAFPSSAVSATSQGRDLNGWFGSETAAHKPQALAEISQTSGSAKHRNVLSPVLWFFNAEG